MGKIIRAASIFAIVLAIGVSVTACSGSVTVSPTGGAISVGPDVHSEAPAAPTSNAADEMAAAGAKSAMDQILEQLKADIAVGKSRLTEGMTEEERVAAEDEAYSNTLSHVKADSFTPSERKDVVFNLSQFFMNDVTAVVESDISDYKIDGYTATVDLRDFDKWYDGKEEGERPTLYTNAGILTLTLEDGKWVITGFESRR
jgi:hypothetical protein